jgi:hypothetical protein
MDPREPRVHCGKMRSIVHKEFSSHVLATPRIAIVGFCGTLRVALERAVLVAQLVAIAL